MLLLAVEVVREARGAVGELGVVVPVAVLCSEDDEVMVVLCLSVAPDASEIELALVRIVVVKSGALVSVVRMAGEVPVAERFGEAEELLNWLDGLWAVTVLMVLMLHPGGRVLVMETTLVAFVVSLIGLRVETLDTPDQGLVLFVDQVPADDIPGVVVL